MIWILMFLPPQPTPTVDEVLTSVMYSNPPACNYFPLSELKRMNMKLLTPDKLRTLADWFDVHDAQASHIGTEVQDDLRSIADEFAQQELSLKTAYRSLEDSLDREGQLESKVTRLQSMQDTFLKELHDMETEEGYWIVDFLCDACRLKWNEQTKLLKERLND